MSTTIIVKFQGKCTDCGSVVPVGAEARYYGRGKLYGTTCHPQKGESAVTEIAAPATVPTPQVSVYKPRKVSLRTTTDSAPSTYHQARVLVPGKDHRKTFGKATFSGKGQAIKCNSIAYLGRPIVEAPTGDERACIKSLERTFTMLAWRIAGHDPATNPRVPFHRPTWTAAIDGLALSLYGYFRKNSTEYALAA